MPIEPDAFLPSELPERLQHWAVSRDGKVRKVPLKFEECPLMEMAQYNCDVAVQDTGDAVTRRIVCKPVIRLFRNDV
ncbi:hypothetical protein P152DRAFT_477583 [Eremomyces bilateralis CBS 781.70]|uniref:Uncharacterized protein n=1 Tax=Eremomyces bilateralis CBS 781.70 TaxID=1392243 RepID=A0A6G1FR02_9PEZI|nr:uncharacterized protein P152DRAFT_477583 [Eremomyces bilateralis CBS 781.70]KAF1808111.1 hypothetical protein P152DRAFT_477583 [Eremomyces bilateralis CBS 781.70]